LEDIQKEKLKVEGLKKELKNMAVEEKSAKPVEKSAKTNKK
tara:strand:+ start:827 stop:949 length:123 start_codon:yes stop_codon:yes gene_type:complete